jgi:hypothetical protein
MEALVMRLLARTTAAMGLLLPLALASRAETVTYDFVTSNTPFGIISTSLPGPPTPVSFTPTSFELAAAPIDADGEKLHIVVDFYTTLAGGGVSGRFDDDDDVYRYEGPELFSGSTSSPTFLTGTFPVDDFSLTITPEGPTPSGGPGVMPEPSTLVLFGIGLLVGGGLLRLKLSSARTESSRKGQLKA